MNHTTITTICSVCKKVLSITEGFGVSGTSHGLCRKHYEEALAKLECPECHGDGLARTKPAYPGQDMEPLVLDEPCKSCGGESAVDRLAESVRESGREGRALGGDVNGDHRDGLD